MIILIAWILLGVWAIYIDVRLCIMDNERIKVKELVIGSVVHLCLAPLTACWAAYQILKRSDIKIFKYLRDFWNKEIL